MPKYGNYVSSRTLCSWYHIIYLMIKGLVQIKNTIVLLHGRQLIQWTPLNSEHFFRSRLNYSQTRTSKDSLQWTSLCSGHHLEFGGKVLTWKNLYTATRAESNCIRTRVFPLSKVFTLIHHTACLSVNTTPRIINQSLWKLSSGAVDISTKTLKLAKCKQKKFQLFQSILSSTCMSML